MMIRPARKNDADGIAHVHVESWRTTYNALLPADFLAGISKQTWKRNWQEVLSRRGTNTMTFVAEKDGEIIGFVNGGQERTENPHFVGELYSLYLMESFRRQGIGAALFQKVIELLRSVHLTAMKVWVLSDHPYRPFYVRQGGNIIEEKIITIGETDLIELAYGWQSLEASGNIYHA